MYKKIFALLLSTSFIAYASDDDIGGAARKLLRTELGAAVVLPEQEMQELRAYFKEGQNLSAALYTRLDRAQALGMSVSLIINLGSIDGVESLTQLLNHCSAVTELDLSHNEICDDEAIAIANCANLANLRDLNLAGNEIEYAGAVAICGSPHLGRLASLSFKDNPIQGDDIHTHFLNLIERDTLKDIDLAGTGFTDANVQAMAASESIRKLTRLDLSCTSIGEEGLEAIAASDKFNGLELLGLQRDPQAEEEEPLNEDLIARLQEACPNVLLGASIPE